MRTPLAIPAAAAVALLLAGCAPQLDRIEASLDRNTAEVAAVRAEQQALRNEMQSLNELLRLEQDAGMETEALRTARLGQLSRQMDELIRRLEDSGEFMRSLSARVDLIARGGQLPPPANGGGGPPAGGPPPESGETATLAPLPEEGRSIFNAAQLDRSRGNLDLAKEGFRDFLSQYPSSELADDALYQMGDLAFGEDQFQEALERFEELLTTYPQTEYAPAALLKSGFALESLGRPDDSRGRLEELVERFPGSPEADLARERLSAGG